MPQPEQNPLPGRPASPQAVSSPLTDAGALWEAVQRTSGEYIVVLDPSGDIRFVNRVDEGFALEQVIGHDITQFALPESAERIRQLLDEVVMTGAQRALETMAPRPDGSLNYFSMRLGPILVGGRIVAVMACCANIRPLKASEQALQQERRHLQALIGIQERERRLVSYEIHDGLAQYLASATMHFEAFEHATAKSSGGKQDFREGLRLLRAATAEARRLIGGLRPPALDELGIVDAVESLVTEARKDVPNVHFHHAIPATRFPADVETAVFRIVQESLNNVRRHANATTVNILLQATTDGVRILIQDDGVGFDPTALPPGRFGIEGIRQRALLLGGEPLIVSRPGSGTTIDVRLPTRPMDP